MFGWREASGIVQQSGSAADFEAGPAANFVALPQFHAIACSLQDVQVRAFSVKNLECLFPGPVTWKLCSFAAGGSDWRYKGSGFYQPLVGPCGLDGTSVRPVKVSFCCRDSRSDSPWVSWAKAKVC